LSGKDDISQHEKTLANLLHQEIFETGRYFKETSESACFRQRAKEKEFLLHQEVTYKSVTQINFLSTLQKAEMDKQIFLFKVRTSQVRKFLGSSRCCKICTFLIEAICKRISLNSGWIMDIRFASWIRIWIHMLYKNFKQ
jgi:hypothetical protein